MSEKPEKFNHQEYRNQLAEDLKGIEDVSEKREALESEQGSWRYQQAKERHHDKRPVRMERRARSKAKIEEKHKQWIANIEALKELNRRPETIRDKEAVHKAIEKYFADAERDTPNPNELTAPLQKKDAKQFSVVMNTLEKVRAGLNSIEHFHCCFGDDLWGGKLGDFGGPFDSSYMDLNDLQALLGQISDENCPKPAFESADEQTRKRINAVLLNSLLDTIEAMTYTSMMPGSKAGNLPNLLDGGGSENLGGLERISADLGEELSLGAPEVLRELAMRIVRSLPEGGKGVLKERLDQVRNKMPTNCYQNYLEKLDLESID